MYDRLKLNHFYMDSLPLDALRNYRVKLQQ